MRGMSIREISMRGLGVDETDADSGDVHKRGGDKGDANERDSLQVKRFVFMATCNEISTRVCGVGQWCSIDCACR